MVAGHGARRGRPGQTTCGSASTVSFREKPDGTRITFNWYVRLTNPAFNLLGYVAEGMYRHSHDSVMDSAEKGLSEYCGRRATP